MKTGCSVSPGQMGRLCKSVVGESGSNELKLEVSISQFAGRRGREMRLISLLSLLCLLASAFAIEFNPYDSEDDNHTIGKRSTSLDSFDSIDLPNHFLLSFLVHRIIQHR